MIFSTFRIFLFFHLSGFDVKLSFIEDSLARYQLHIGHMHWLLIRGLVQILDGLNANLGHGQSKALAIWLVNAASMHRMPYDVSRENR